MKITDIKTIKLHYPYKSWIVDGCGSCGARGAFLIFIETDTELTGIGEAATFGSSMEAMESIVEKQLKPLLLEEDPSKIEFLHQKMLWNCWEWLWARSAALTWLSGICWERQPNFQFASFWARWQTGCRDMQVLDFMQRERAWKICKKKSKDIWIEDLPLLK